MDLGGYHKIKITENPGSHREDRVTNQYDSSWCQDNFITQLLMTGQASANYIPSYRSKWQGGNDIASGRTDSFRSMHIGLSMSNTRWTS